MEVNDLVNVSQSDEPDHLISLLRRLGRGGSPAVLLHVDSVVDAYSPRVDGQDFKHACLLAEVDTELPPIVVHRATMKVIDGMHRLWAAKLRGESHIRAEFFDGEEDDAFLVAVALNRKHGLPLSSTDRLAAIERIIRSHPDWSDRALAGVVGVSTKKVSQVRRGLGIDQAEEGSRIGRDGRSRPLNIAARRQHASELIKEDPCCSLRKIAKVAGLSPATVADVRNRIRNGDDPVPGRDAAEYKKPSYEDSDKRVQMAAPPSLPQILTPVEKLRRDPALRLSESGRTVLRALDAWAIAAKEKHRIVETMPAHCLGPMAEVMYALAGLCQSFGDDLVQVCESAYGSPS